MDPTDRRPLFASSFPRHPALDALVQAFARGDYALVRSEGSKLSGSAAEEDVRTAARTLVERTEPDPLAIWLLVLTGGLLITLSTYWITHGKPPSENVRSQPHEPAVIERSH
ncbi:MAG: hypothetical protein WBY94_23675 [Polyangiaceae bacterium]